MVLLFSQTWFIDGLIVPCRVSGGSMAVALLGRHRDVVCTDCGFGFFCDSGLRPVSSRAVCPNCGHINIGVESIADLDGDRVLIDRSAFHFRRPRRWEIVAFRHAQEAGKILIKRVVGLPGESVQINNGDVYVDGQIQRKTLDRQRAMAVMVYDAKYSPAIQPTPPERWRGENEKTRWNSAGGEFRHPSPHPSPLSEGEGTVDSHLPEGEGTIDYTRQFPEGEGTVDWLVYHHWRRVADGQGNVKECPISDIMAYNQSVPRREEDVHAMDDLMLSFRLVKTFGQGFFFIRAITGQDVFQVEIDPQAGTYRATGNGREILGEDNRIAGKIEELDIVVSLIDRQFLLAFNGRTVICLAMDETVSQSESTSKPFALGTDGLGVEVKDLRIYRDVYYTHPIGWHGRWGIDNPIQLRGDEYFVLGDNSSIAEDSRTWSEHPAVADNSLIGKPLMMIFPAKSNRIGDWQFQVPDLHRIGYIR